MQREGVRYIYPEYPLPYFSSGYPYGCLPPSVCVPPFHHYSVASIQSPRDAPSNCNSPYDSENEPPSFGSSRPTSSQEYPHLFRPIDFDKCENTTPYYPPTPSNSDSSCAENEATLSPCIESSISKAAISVSLVQEEMWEAFRAIGNEMIVTKPGRRFFPAVLVNIRGLIPDMQYVISINVTSASSFRYRFLNGQWVAVGESEILQDHSRQTFLHPNSPSSGQLWMMKPISFKNVKITHKPTSKHGHILLHTMHKYMLEILIEGVGLGQPVKIRLPQSAFIAVTSYQNNRLTQLKIENNPFAKGFRDKENIPFFHPSQIPPLFGSRPLWQMPHFSYPVPAAPSSTPSAKCQRDCSCNPLYVPTSASSPTHPPLHPVGPTYLPTSASSPTHPPLHPVGPTYLPTSASSPIHPPLHPVGPPYLLPHLPFAGSLPTRATNDTASTSPESDGYSVHIENCED